MKTNKISPQTNVQLSKEGRPNVILNELRDKINSNENLKIDFDKCVKYIKQQNIRQINLKRAKVIVYAYDGKHSIKEIAEILDLSQSSIYQILNSFIKLGFDKFIAPQVFTRQKALVITDEKAIVLNQLIIAGTKGALKILESNQFNLKSDDFDSLMADLQGKEVFTQSMLAKCINVSVGTLNTYIKRTKLQIRASGSYCVSLDTQYEDKARRIDFLYKTPPAEGECVLCVDEKTCIQANYFIKYRTYKGRLYCSCRYTRNGVVNLIAALNPHTGEVYYDFQETKTKKDFHQFLADLVQKYESLKSMKKIHLVLDNLNTHKKYDADWYEQHHMFTFNFTPTSASWINLVESFFGNLTRSALKGVAWKDKNHLKAGISDFINYYNDRKKQPFKWRFDVQHNLNQRLHTLKALADAGVPAADKAYREEFAKRNSAEIVANHVNENNPKPEYIDLSGEEVPLQFS